MFSQHRYASFYLPIGRVWELLLGAFVAFYLQNNESHKTFSQKYNQLFSLVGFILIIISVVFLDNRYIPPFPNIYTLIPTCGATLIIIFGEKTTFIGYLLSTRLLRWIGLISYSAYLWHQPLLAFIRLQSDQTPSILTIIIAIIGVFPLSILSYLFIEQPFRDKKRFSQKQIFVIAGIATFITLILALFLIRTANNRSSLMLKKGADSYLYDLQNYGNQQYLEKGFRELRQKKKTFSNNTSTLNRRVLLIGDSFTQDFYNMINEGKHLINYDVCGHFVSWNCQMYLGPEDRLKFIGAPFKKKCTNAYEIKDALPMIRQADIIILSSLWEEWSAQRLPTTIKSLNLTKQQQLFILGPKSFGSFNARSFGNKSDQYRIQQYRYPDSKIVKVNNLLAKTIDKSIYVNIPKMVCTGPNQTCPLFTPQAKLISFDGLHLTKYGALYIGNIIFKNKPLDQLKQVTRRLSEARSSQS